MTRCHRHETRVRRRRGFTLMEVLLVLAILGVIAAIVVPNLLGSQEKANIKATKLQINEIEKFCGLYALDHNGTLPQSLDLLTQPYENDGVEVKPITGKVPVDAWGNPFNYDAAGSHQKIKKPDIWSNGPNGTNDNGEGDDVNNWSHLEE